MRNNTVKTICTVGILLALAIVFSAFLQIPIVGDIRIDLSYTIIILICYLYGPVIGGFSAMSVAMFESSIFTAYGFSISWSVANLFLGLVVGLVFDITKKMHGDKVIKHVINVSAIVIATAIAMLLIKTLIECKLYEIPFAVKVAKNAVAFGLDTASCLIGYFCILPVIKRVFFKNEGEAIHDKSKEVRKIS